MDERSNKEGEDGMDDCLAASLTIMPPRRNKLHSYSQQLGPTAARHEMTQHRNSVRKHSLDEACISRAIPDPRLLHEDDSSASRHHRPEFVNHFLASPTSDHDGSDRGGPLPEFSGAGGGTGIFKVPLRAAVHPGRPPPLELRPHPLRETQAGSFVRTIACTDRQIWAGFECGLRYWEFFEAFRPGFGASGNGTGRRGDEDTAPFWESARVSPTMCMVVDAGNRLVWTGHRDGKIRSWMMDQNPDVGPFREGFAWNAHRGPVLAIVISAYGDLWSGAEGGVIKVWPWEFVEKSLNQTAEERHMAALKMERACIDLRNLVTVNGVSQLPSSDVKYLLSDNSRAKVWSAWNLSFALWWAIVYTSISKPQLDS